MLKEIYKNICSNTRSIRHYRECYEDMLDESVSLHIKYRNTTVGGYFLKKKGSKYFQDKYFAEHNKELSSTQLLSYASKLFASFTEEEKKRWKEKQEKAHRKLDKLIFELMPVIDPGNENQALLEKQEHAAKTENLLGNDFKKLTKASVKRAIKREDEQTGMTRVKPKYPDQPCIFYQRNLKYFEENEGELLDNKHKKNDPSQEEVDEAEIVYASASKEHKLECMRCCMEQLKRYREEMSKYKLLG